MKRGGGEEEEEEGEEEMICDWSSPSNSIVIEINL